jgi:hypothetical protein
MQIKATSELSDVNFEYSIGLPESGTPKLPNMFSKYSKLLVEMSTCETGSSQYDSQHVDFKKVAEWLNEYIGALNSKIKQLSDNVFGTGTDSNSLSAKIKELSSKLASDNRALSSGYVAADKAISDKLDDLSSKLASDNRTLSSGYVAADKAISDRLDDLSSNALLKNSNNVQNVMSNVKFNNVLTASINGNAAYADSAGTASNADYATRAGSANIAYWS